MKVLLICTTPSWGGLEQTAYRDAVRLSERGVQTHLLCLNDGKLPELAKAAGIPVHQIKNKGKHLNLELYLKLKDLLKKENYDVVHLHSFNTIFPSLMALMRSKAFVCATRHIYVEHKKKDLFHKWYLNRIDKMLAISEFSKNNILATYPLNKDKIEALYLGIDLERYKKDKDKGLSVRRRYGIPSDALLAGVVGRIDPAKGQMEFIEAIPAILKQNKNAYFVITGRTTAEKEESYLTSLKSRIRDLDIEQRVIFTGFMDDIRPLLSALDVLVMPSYFEAFGLIAIEAMACMVPVVATNMGSVNEIIPNDSCGLRIAPRSFDGISKAVNTLFASSELRDAMAVAAIKNVSSLFDERKYFDRLITIYKEAGVRT